MCLMESGHKVIGRQIKRTRQEEHGHFDRSPTIISDENTDSLDELSDYLDVLSSNARLRIIKLLEKKPRDARAIANEIETSYENTKKHLDKLLAIGVIKKEAGLGAPTSKGIHPVWHTRLSLAGLRRSSVTSGCFPMQKSRLSVVKFPDGLMR